MRYVRCGKGVCASCTVLCKGRGASRRALCDRDWVVAMCGAVAAQSLHGRVMSYQRLEGSKTPTHGLQHHALLLPISTCHLPLTVQCTAMQRQAHHTTRT